MKFDAVVGNPPYQMVLDNNNENYASPIYHEFLKVTFKLGTKVSLIHPARCLFNAGKTPEEFNKQILNDKHFKIIRYEMDSGKFFPNTDIKGGVAITYYDPDEDFGAVGIFIPFKELESIYKKVVINNKNFSPMSEIVYAAESYGFTEKLHKDFPNAKNILSKGHAYDITTNIFETLPQVFFDDKPNDGAEYVQILGRENNQRTCKWIRRDYVTAPENFEYYKIIIPKSNGSGAIGEKLSTPLVGLPLVGLPLVGSTQTFITLGRYQNEAEAQSALKFVKTKFARALLGVLKITQDNKAKTWACVPLQNFTASSDIDWSRSIAEIDAQLYKKYKLAQEEINFIESKVTAME